MEADHREAPARAEHLERRGERCIDGAELVVDGDAQRLEDALCRMTVAEPRRRRDHGLDRLDQLSSPLERLIAVAAPDRPRNLPRVAYLPVLGDVLLQLAPSSMVNELAGSGLPPRIH